MEKPVHDATARKVSDSAAAWRCGIRWTGFITTSAGAATVGRLTRQRPGLIDLGINVGDRVAILSENRFDWLIADHAILSSGAADVPLHAPLSAKQVEYQVGHSEARGIVVSGQIQADKVFEVLDSLPLLEFLISFDAIDVPECRLKTPHLAGTETRLRHDQQRGDRGPRGGD